LDYYEPQLLSDARLYHANGQILDEVYEYGSFLQSRMHANRVRCSDCHDPHSLQLRFQGNKLCTQCHIAGKYDTPTHHHHKEGSTGGQCIECHMPARMYMGIDKRRDHGFRVPRPDLTVEFGTPNACNDCHTKPEETPQWAADAVRKWFGEKRHDDPHWTPAFAAAREGKPEGEKLLLELLGRRTTPLIVQATAIDLLGNYRSEAAIKAQREAMYRTEPLMRLTAIRAIPLDSSTLPDVARMLRDPVRRVRLAAVERLVDVPIDALTDEQRRAFEDVMVEFRKTQEMSLDQAGGNLAMAILARRYNRPEEAVERLRTAIRLQPYLAGPRLELASLLEEKLPGTEMDRFPGTEKERRQLREEEVRLLERDAKLAPNNPAIFYQLAKTYYNLGKQDPAEYAKAAAAIDKACEIAPQSFEYLFFKALLHHKRYELTGDEEQFNLGFEAVKKLQELQPNDQQVQQILFMLMEARRVKEGGDPAAAPQGTP
jgi:predicted CXXCH cytochrome family protein